MSVPDKMLVVRLSSLGDVLMTLPAVKAIKDASRERHITWLVEGPVGDLLAHQAFIDRVIRFPRSAITSAWRKGHVRLAGQEMVRFLNELRRDSYNTVVDFHGIIKSVFFSHWARGRTRVGFGRTFAKEQSHLFYETRIDAPEKRIHKVERNMLIARHLGARGAIPEVSLSVPGYALRYVESFLAARDLRHPLVAINPFSSKGSEFKRWGLENYGRLIKRIRHAFGADIVILWGPGEQSEAERLQREAGDGAHLACPTDILQLLALLKTVDIYAGGDTGVMHLAVLAGIPVVAIFGPTDHKINAPYGGNSVMVRKELACSPCKQKDCREKRCLETIGVDEVFDTVAARLRVVRTRPKHPAPGTLQGGKG
jgi:heptosyltransferase-1